MATRIIDPQQRQNRTRRQSSVLADLVAAAIRQRQPPAQKHRSDLAKVVAYRRWQSGKILQIPALRTKDQ